MNTQEEVKEEKATEPREVLTSKHLEWLLVNSYEFDVEDDLEI